MRHPPPILAALLLAACSGPEPNVRSADPYERYLGAKELAGNGAAEGRMREIVALLEDKHPLAVLGALEALAAIGEPNALQHLPPLVKHPHSLVRGQVCATVAALKNPDGIALVLEAYKGSVARRQEPSKEASRDGEALVAREAVKALAAFGPRPEVLRALAEDVGDKDASVSFMAHEKLQELTGRKDVPRSKAAWEKALAP